MEYHNCELVMALPIPTADGSLYYMGGYASMIDNNNFIIHGITPIVFEIAGKFYNFTVDYQRVIMDHEYIRGEP